MKACTLDMRALLCLWAEPLLGPGTVKEDLLLLVAQKVPILPPIGPRMESRTLARQMAGWDIESQLCVRHREDPN